VLESLIFTAQEAILGVSPVSVALLGNNYRNLKAAKKRAKTILEIMPC